MTRPSLVACPKIAWEVAVLCAVLSCALWTTVRAAEFQGEDVDGRAFDATAYSYSTGRYYDVEVEFDGDEATLSFASGGMLTVTLDDEEIDDPSSIDAFDYARGVYWELDVEGLD